DQHLVAAQVFNARGLATGVTENAQDAGVSDHIQQPGLHGFGNRRNGSRTLGRHMAATAIAEAVVEAAGAITIDFRVDRGWPLEGFPAKLTGGIAHHVGEAGTAQAGHRIGTGPWTLKLVATGYYFTVDVAGVARDSQRILHAIVEGLQLFVTERPILNGRVLRDAVSTVAVGGFADNLEIPGIQAPALGPVVHRGATHPIHHGMPAPLNGFEVDVGTGSRNLAFGLGHGLGPVTQVVANLVGSEITCGKPAAGLETNHVESGAALRQHGDATARTMSEHYHVSSGELSGHDCLPARQRPDLPDPWCRSPRHKPIACWEAVPCPDGFLPAWR